MGNRNSKEYICGECVKENHDSCESKLSCKCKCNIGGVADVTEKVLSTVGGVGAAIGGLVLTLSTGGLAIPIGGAIMSAGISSAYQGIEKSIKKERIDGREYAADVGFGAITGVLTGGIGGAGEALASTVAKKLVCRAGAGAVAGVTAKAIDEIKVCTTTDKKWSDYGKTHDKEGNCSVGGTAITWIASAAVGTIGGASTHISSGVSNAVASNLEKATVRVVISGASGSATDALSQGLNIAAGNQDEYDVKRTILAGTVSATITGAMEGARNGIYAYHGGEEKFLEKRANKDLIKNTVPANEKDQALKALDELNKVPSKDLNAEIQKAKDYTDWKNKNDNFEARKTKLEKSYDTKIKRQLNLRSEAQMRGDTDKVKVHQRKFESLKQQKDYKISNINKALSNNPQIVKKSDINNLGSNNAHPLVDKKFGQLAVDVKDSADVNRGPKRLIVDYERKQDGSIGLKVSDYTSEHDYKNTNGYGQSNYDKYHDKNNKFFSGLNNACEYGQKAIIAEEYDSDND